MKFIDSLTDYKQNGIAHFDTTKQTTSTIVKELLPKQLQLIKNNFKKYKELINLLNHYVNATIVKVNTKAMLQSWVRKLIKDTYGDDSKQYKFLRDGFSMTAEERIDRQKIADDKVEQSNLNQIELTEQQINEFKGKLLSPKWRIVPAIIFAQIASGCRLIEVLSHEFEFTEAGKEGYIIQNNVAKNRGEDRKVDKPVLFIKPEQFLRLIKIIRDKMTVKPEDDNIALSNRYGKRVNAKITQIARGVDTKGITSSHDLRRIYANLSYKQFAKKNTSLQVWVSKILGHSDLTSAANYTTLNIV